MASPIASFPMFLNELQGRFIHCKPSKYRYLSRFAAFEQCPRCYCENEENGGTIGIIVTFDINLKMSVNVCFMCASHCHTIIFKT